MSERTIEQIHKEYSEACSHAGHLQYQIDMLKEELEKLNSKRKELNKEASELASRPKE